MENKMAHEFVERRESFFRLRATSNNLEKIASQALLNWVMSCIETIYWEDHLNRIAFDVTLYAQDDMVILIYKNIPSRKESRFIFKQDLPGKLLKILKNFVKDFNDTRFHKHNYIVSSPHFHAEEPVTAGSSDFNGCYYVVYINIEMRTDIEDEFRA
ncbi:MAG: hypothetical protein IJ223_06460 [Clostridia bacterium]|nr:hypothetical protein [Clostridia bacterium]